MKRNLTALTALLLALIAVFSFASCNKAEAPEEIWENALYTENTELGSGEKTVYVTVEAGEKSVVFTVHTDEKTLGDALIKLDLVEGEKGSYGLYVKKVNGILADYDINQVYWGFFKEGELLNTGIDFTEISDGEKYEIVYSK